MKYFRLNNVYDWKNISALLLQKTLQQQLILKMTFINHSITHSKEKLCNTLETQKKEFLSKTDFEKIPKRQSKLMFIENQKSDTNYGSYTFMQKEVFLDKPICLEFAILELSKLLIFET